MKIKVSKVMAKYMNKQLPEYRFTVIELSDDNYHYLTGEDVYTAEDWGDFNYNTRATKVIKIEYPDEYYATPRYVSTKELNKIFKGIKDIEVFNNEIRNAFEV